MASVIARSDFDGFNGFNFNGFDKLRCPRAPLPLNLPSRKSERDSCGEEKPRAWTYMKSVRGRSTSNPDPTPPSTPEPTPAPSSPPPVQPKQPPVPKTSTKTCSSCLVRKDKSCFSKKQWSAGKGRKCADCVQPPPAPVVAEKPAPVEPVEPVAPSTRTETRWDTMKANNDSKFEEEAGLLRLAEERRSRKPVRHPPRPPAPAPAPASPIIPRIRHKICQTAKKGYRCKIGDSCDGAHNLAEYAPPPCSWGSKCRHVKSTPDGLVNMSDRPCTFIHPDETQEHYHKRSGRHAPRFWTR